jgi:DNA polymerase III sliding clamp (beta) subunit (PCNA family)
MTIIDFAAYMGAKVCRAKNDVRYYLNAIYIDAEGFIVATDGHRLFCDKVQTNQPEGILVDVKGKEPAKFSYAEISTEAKSISFYTAEHGLLATLPVELVDGRFPDWRRVARVEAGKVETIGFTMSYLVDAAKVAKLYKKAVSKFEFQDSSRACKIHFSDTAYMIIMPARVI